MDLTVAIFRILLGAILLVANYRLLVQHKMSPMTSKEGALMKAFGDSGYLIPLIKGTEIIAGVLLICNVWVPFALVFLAPVTVNIFLFHLFLGKALFQKESMAGLLVTFLHLLLFWAYRDAFMPLFSSDYSFF